MANQTRATTCLERRCILPNNGGDNAVHDVLAVYDIYRAFDIMRVFARVQVEFVKLNRIVLYHFANLIKEN